ncbi:hypothetical protein OG921_25755 [Aldersonia sp. NBC_00410]|uniref:hypothetical protein n=1 Tax=Aldersonia sp. NBC_00410 TaxID=2975954 RepID=UPI002255B9C2|nr:hypothetical protein [Aldersonia sp. NBC_00410]MCX5046582.1 hypothetical protein [Aldersonia sp. NBC_00410]
MTNDGAAAVPELPGEQFLRVGLTGPLAAWVSDLESIARDLNFARECAHGYATRLGANNELADPLIAQALWNAGSIAYRRAFNSGRGHIENNASRPRLADKLVNLLTDEQTRAHEQVYEMANQHIAHRVGDHEGATVVAFLNPPPHARAIAGVGTLGAHMIGPERTVAERLIDVCGVFLEALAAEGQRCMTAIREDLDGNADLDAMYARAAEIAAAEGAVPVPNPGPSDQRPLAAGRWAQHVRQQ